MPNNQYYVVHRQFTCFSAFFLFVCLFCLKCLEPNQWFYFTRSLIKLCPVNKLHVLCIIPGLLVVNWSYQFTIKSSKFNVFTLIWRKKNCSHDFIFSSHAQGHFSCSGTAQKYLLPAFSSPTNWLIQFIEIITEADLLQDWICNPLLQFQSSNQRVPTLLYQLRQGCTTSGSSIPCSSMYQMLKLKLGPQDIRGTKTQRKDNLEIGNKVKTEFTI